MAEAERIGSGWLALREPVDAVARAAGLVERLPAADRRVIHDLGCGTGSMGRWLAPRLRGAQHWVLHDHDPDLLALAEANLPGAAADGAPVTAETRATDLAALQGDDLRGATLVTGSALLDLLSARELDRLVAACMAPACPVLFPLSVVGRVDLTPADPLDARVAAAFNDHQRRPTSRGRLLGPDAVATATAAFAATGAEVAVEPSPWQLGEADAELTTAWFAGWLRAACEQDPALGPVIAGYAAERRAQLAAGELAVVVHHADLLVLPR